jgi:hypothetical protein
MPPAISFILSRAEKLANNSNYCVTVRGIAGSIADACAEEGESGKTLQETEKMLLAALDPKTLGSRDVIPLANVWNLLADVIIARFSGTASLEESTSRERRTIKIGSAIMARRIELGIGPMYDDEKKLFKEYESKVYPNPDFASIYGSQLQTGVSVAPNLAGVTPDGIRGMSLSQATRTISSKFSADDQKFDGDLSKPLAFDMFEKRYRSLVSLFDISDATFKINLLADALSGAALRFFYENIVPELNSAGPVNNAQQRMSNKARRAAPRGHFGTSVSRHFPAYTHRWGCTLTVVYGS